MDFLHLLDMLYHISIQGSSFKIQSPVKNLRLFCSKERLHHFDTIFAPGSIRTADGFARLAGPCIVQ